MKKALIFALEMVVIMVMSVTVMIIVRGVMGDDREAEISMLSDKLMESHLVTEKCLGKLGPEWLAIMDSK